MGIITLIHPSDERVREELALRASTIISKEDDDVCLRLMAPNIANIIVYERYAPLSRRIFTLESINHASVGMFMKYSVVAKYSTDMSTDHIMYATIILILNGNYSYCVPDIFGESIKSQLIYVCNEYVTTYKLEYNDKHSCDYCGTKYGVRLVRNYYYCVSCAWQHRYKTEQIIKQLKLCTRSLKNNVYLIGNIIYVGLNQHAFNVRVMISIALNYKPGMQVIIDQKIIYCRKN